MLKTIVKSTLLSNLNLCLSFFVCFLLGTMSENTLPQIFLLWTAKHDNGGDDFTKILQKSILLKIMKEGEYNI